MDHVIDLISSWAQVISPDYYMQTGEISLVVIQSGILAFFVAGTTSVLCFIKASTHRKAHNFLWLGLFTGVYALWNIVYLSTISETGLSVLSAALTVDVARRLHFILGLILPLLASRFFMSFFSRKAFRSAVPFFCIAGLLVVLVVPTTRFYFAVSMVSGLIIFGSFFFLALQLWRVYRNAEDLKQRTRSYFLLIGIGTCAFFSLIGQIRAERLIPNIPLPFVGNTITAVFLYFIYQMVLNPRLREVRELMLRGIRVLILTVILSVIFLSLLAWVGADNVELFIFNTFIASFIILSVLEPLRKKIDTFFLKQFIVDRYEFEEILKRLLKKLRTAKNLEGLAQTLMQGVRESGRVYQTGLFLWDPPSETFTLVESSNLTFKTSLPMSHPFVSYFRKDAAPLLLEQDQDLDPKIQEELRDLHAHIVLPLIKNGELVGLWALRSSLRSTNPYTSFSNDEIELLELVTAELITVLEQLQHFETKERQERLVALGEMSAALAHEIRNPLGAMQGALQLLETSQGLQELEDRECVSILRKEMDRLQQVVDQYLHFARKTEEASPVAVSVLMQKVLQSLKSKAERTKTLLHLQGGHDLPPMMTDYLKLEQVLINLIQNACEAYAKNVWIDLSFHKKRGDESVFEIAIRDDGPGIPSHVLPNIFTPLFTTKKAGTGLGLPICKKIIESLGGEINVESKLNHGTTFRLFIPQKGPRSSEAAAH